jgi:ATP-binding cassette subfamily B protein IrtB
MTGNKEAPQCGDIIFEHVSFKYQKKEVLHDINTSMHQGTLTALVGPSGSGKSTLMKLCARFYDPQQGKVLFNGIPMSNIDPESLMKHISMVFQDVYLFKDTIKNNLRFSKPDATDEEIIAAAKKACCHEFILKLPNGYDTMVGEGGCTLSGGEKQRISIARAILKNAEIVLLDEATASLDPENEVDVQNAINSLITGRTVIVIAHRLKTIKNADKIIVLDKGLIVEQGTHNDLINKNGLYCKLWTIQEKTAGWKL